MPAQKIFVNLPVNDLKRSMAFFKKLGYTFNPKFSDDNGACMVISDDIYAMLLTETFFKTFITKDIADTRKTTEVIVALSCESRTAVDDVVRKAFAAGAREHRKPQDHGFMYEWGFEDPDGHIWSYFWMDPKAATEGPPQG